MITIKSKWDEFVRVVFENQEISETQRIWTERAFYAGFISCLTLDLEEADGTEGEAIDILAALCDEANEYRDNRLKEESE